MSVCFFLAIHPVDIEIFDRISENVDLLVALEGELGDLQSFEDSSSWHHGYLY